MEEKEKANVRFGEWEHYAIEDEQIILLALKEDGPPNQICLHAQQMAEKYLKGFLVYHNNTPLKIHNVGKLIEECGKYDDSFLQLMEYSLLLNQFYIEARYPGDIIEFSLEQAKEGYDAAKKIREFILSRV